MSGSIDACHTPVADITETVDKLADEGWRVVDGSPSPDLVELLIWPQVAFYATGDSGGEPISALVELQRKTVAGFARKADLETSKTRILKRQIGAEQEAALVFWLQPEAGQTEVICRFALSATSYIAHTRGDFSVPQSIEAGLGKSYSFTTLNAGSLSEKIAAPVTVSGTLETRSVFEAVE